MDGAVSARIVLARDAWLRGHPAQAQAIAQEAWELAAAETPFSECQTLSLAGVPIALWSGDTALAQHLVARLQLLAVTYSLGYYVLWGRVYAAVLALWQERGPPSPAQAQAPLDLPDGGLVLLRDHLCTIDGRLRDGNLAARLAAGTAGWCAPELLRLRALDAVDPAGGEALLRQALALAREQGALAWELRAALTGVHRLGDAGLKEAAHRLLAPVVERFDAGAETADLRRARALLA
jgi:hypothetical protein